MNLTGGIDMYSFNKRYKSDIPPKGRKVFFLDDNGYDIQLESARRFFTKGQVLTVEEIYVGRFNSEVEFQEYPNMKFNTVMFADITEIKE